MKPELSISIENIIRNHQAYYYQLYLLMLAMAFSTRVKEKILKRDNHTCSYPGCFKKENDGWRIIAAHIDHTKNNNYDNPKNGKAHCIEHEIQYHQRLLEKAIHYSDKQGIKDNQRALELLAEKDHRTDDYRQKHFKES